MHKTSAKRHDRFEPPFDRRTDRSLIDVRSAVHRDDADGLLKLLSEKPELFTRQFGSNNETLLTEAARAGKINAAPLHLMAEHPDVTWATRPLDRTEIIPDLRDRKLDTPLHLAE